MPAIMRSQLLDVFKDECSGLSMLEYARDLKEEGTASVFETTLISHDTECLARETTK
jgi:hypothetical protein